MDHGECFYGRNIRKQWACHPGYVAIHSWNLMSEHACRVTIPTPECEYATRAGFLGLTNVKFSPDGLASEK